jgi:hypothetical protein
MALYGLFVFLETPEPRRRGRKRYIAVSFALTVLRALSGSLDMANLFHTLFKSTSPAHWLVLDLKANHEWKYLSSLTVLGLAIAIGDALLVRAVA